MRCLIIVALVGVFALNQIRPAQAIGCISGGIAGGAAGHLAHHGIMGAIAGCIGGHELNKHQQRQDQQRQGQWNTNYR